MSLFALLSDISNEASLTAKQMKFTNKSMVELTWGRRGIFNLASYYLHTEKRNHPTDNHDASHEHQRLNRTDFLWLLVNVGNNVTSRNINKETGCNGKQRRYEFLNIPSE